MSSARVSIPVAVLVGAATAGCTARPAEGVFGSVERPGLGQTLRFGNGAEPEYLDPGLGSESSGNEIARNLWEGLTEYDPLTLEPVPGVAESWELSEDGTTYTFHLRKEARWSNGDPVTSQDFAWSWIRVLTPETISQYADLLYTFVVNAKGFYQRKTLVVGKTGASLTETSAPGSGHSGALAPSDWVDVLICDRATVAERAPAPVAAPITGRRARIYRESAGVPPIRLEFESASALRLEGPGGKGLSGREVIVVRWSDDHVEVDGQKASWVEVKPAEGQGPTGWMLTAFLREDPARRRCFVRRKDKSYASDLAATPSPPPPAAAPPPPPSMPSTPTTTKNAADHGGPGKKGLVLQALNFGGMPLIPLAQAPPPPPPPPPLPPPPAGWMDRSLLEIDPVVVGIEAPDDHTLVVHLLHPVPFFLELTSWLTFRPVHRASVEKWGKFWTRPKHIVVNGPFTLTEWRIQYQLVLEPNPHYWDASAVRLQKIVALSMDNNHSVMNLYEGGELDWTGPGTSLPGEYMDFLRTRDDVVKAPHLGSYYYWVNVDAPGVRHRKVRQALALTIDREKIVKFVTRAGQIPAAHLVPAGLGGYVPAKGPDHNPELARKVLAEAGFPGGKGLAKITLIYNTSEGHRKIAEAIQQMWKVELGIEVDITNQEWKVFLKNLQYKFFQVGRMGWIGDYRDPYTFLSLLTTGNGHNYGGYSNAEFDSLVEKALRTVDQQERLALYQQAEAIVLRDLPLLPIYIYTRHWAEKPWVRGIFPNDRDMHPFKHMWIDESWKEGDPFGADPRNELGRGAVSRARKHGKLVD